jgi:membrane protease YdiL (CAAX protease family)
MVQENATLMNIGTVLLVPIAEELLYRGLVFRSIHSKSRVWAYVISILVFAALHVVGYIGMYEPMHLFVCLLQYLPAGFCLAWAYERADTIWAPILIHVSVNQMAMMSMMSMSGG